MGIENEDLIEHYEVVLEHSRLEEQGRTLHGTQLDRAAPDEEMCHLYSQLDSAARPIGRVRPNFSNIALARPGR
ncbi:unnamed protein product [Microthlaspi erraticum]|uniref:Uncharacterized protein n=1 Tax=Microthlaspi erraticum TaxID=1685480 RepID=A0A6D2I2Q7_9BRAS|nr:unnamed protein product [Microthlaspi erraticum]